MSSLQSENYSTSKPLKVSAEKSHILSCGTVVALLSQMSDMMFVIALVIRLWKKFVDFVHRSMSHIIPEICTVLVLIGNS